MAKKPSPSAVCETRAEDALAVLRDCLAKTQSALDVVPFTDWLLKLIVPMVRASKTSKVRWTAYEKVQKNWLRNLMLSVGLFEVTVKRTFVMLTPNLGFGQKAEEQYQALLKEYGLTWAKEHVTIEIRIVRKHRASVKTYLAPAGGETIEDEEVVDFSEAIRVTYSIPHEDHPEWTLMEKLKMTIVMGNTISVNVGDISDRVKTGLPRNAKKAK